MSSVPNEFDPEVVKALSVVAYQLDQLRSLLLTRQATGNLTEADCELVERDV